MGESSVKKHCSTNLRGVGWGGGEGSAKRYHSSYLRVVVGGGMFLSKDQTLPTWRLEWGWKGSIKRPNSAHWGLGVGG